MNVLLKNAQEQIHQLEQQVNDANQKLDRRNEDYEKLKETLPDIVLERDKYLQQNIKKDKELHEKNVY